MPWGAIAIPPFASKRKKRGTLLRKGWGTRPKGKETFRLSPVSGIGSFRIGPFLAGKD
jgi:hypothetical protein